MPKRSNYWLGAGLVFGAAFGFALKGIFIKSAYEYGIETISLLSLRFLFSVPFYIFVLSRKRIKEESHPQVSIIIWLKLFAVGFMGYYVSAYFNLLGLNYITASLERILLFVYPTFVLIFRAILQKKQITRLQWLALGITYLGILLAFLKNFDAHQQKNIGLGAFWVIFSGFTYAFYLISSDELIAKLGTTRFTSWIIISALSRRSFIATSKTVLIFLIFRYLSILFHCRWPFSQQFCQHLCYQRVSSTLAQEMLR